MTGSKTYSYKYDASTGRYHPLLFGKRTNSKSYATEAEAKQRAAERDASDRQADEEELILSRRYHF